MIEDTMDTIDIIMMTIKIFIASLLVIIVMGLTVFDPSSYLQTEKTVIQYLSETKSNDTSSTKSVKDVFDIHIYQI